MRWWISQMSKFWGKLQHINLQLDIKIQMDKAQTKDSHISYQISYLQIGPPHLWDQAELNGVIHNML